MIQNNKHNECVCINKYTYEVTAERNLFKFSSSIKFYSFRTIHLSLQFMTLKTIFKKIKHEERGERYEIVCRRQTSHELKTFCCTLYSMINFK